MLSIYTLFNAHKGMCTLFTEILPNCVDVMIACSIVIETSSRRKWLTQDEGD